MNKLFVIDTNILLSAVILPHSTPKKAFDKAQQNGFVVFSDATFAELSEVIHRPKFDKYVTLEDRLLFLDYVKTSCLFFDITQKLTICRDPKDDKFLDIALAAEAHYLVTGDQDLLVLKAFGSTQILTPTQFLATP